MTSARAQNVASARMREVKRRFHVHASKRKLVRQMRAMGLRRGDLVIVHTAFSKTGRIRNGPPGLLRSLEKAVGRDGTLCMPSHSYLHDDPAYTATAEIDSASLEHLRAAVPPFDPATTPPTGMGMVAEIFWRSPGTLRSSHPLAIAARGPKAAEIVRTQSITDPQGYESPIGRIYQLGGKALLIGVKLDRDTTLHVAESLANTPWRQRGHLRFRDGWHPYETRLSCGNSFWRIEPELSDAGLINYGRVGLARSMLIDVRGSVDMAAELLREEPSYFLCAPRSCGGCDRARAIAANP